MPWDPLRDLQAWHERHATPRLEAWTPAIDIYETPDAFVLTAEVPGLAREDIDLSVEPYRVTLSGRRAEHPACPDRPIQFHQIERGRGPFSRTFEFAEPVDVDRVTAHLSGGVLTVELAKLKGEPGRHIPVT